MFKSNKFLLGLSAFIIIFDHITKFIVKNNMYLRESIPIFGNFLRFTYIKNPGMAFGIQIGGRLFYTVFASIACIVILIYLFRLGYEHIWSRIALALILGGAIGNLIDRIIYKEVVDFIDFRMIQWPVFNIADIAVTIGMVILISVVLFEKKEEEAEHYEPR